MATGVKMKDACHIACAELMKCDYLLSTDKWMLKMITEITPPATIELLSRGMECLIRELGVVDTEYFIAAVQRERFDYTKWQREHFDKMDLQNFVDKAAAYAKEKGK